MNIPIAAYTSDDIWLNAWRKCAMPILRSFDPEAIVLQIGADAHALDPLAQVCLTAQGWLAAVTEVRNMGKPIVALGGGGYNLKTVVRMWAAAAAALSGAEIPGEIPPKSARALGVTRMLDDGLPAIPGTYLEAALTFARETEANVRKLLFPYYDITG